MVLNSPGTVDNSYIGEVKVILFNVNNHEFVVNKGMKIAQAVLTSVVNGKWVNLVKKKDINKTDRADKGFGSTGI
jgi:dUTP pyrophosphatase